MFFLFNLGTPVFAEEKTEPKYTFVLVWCCARDPNLGWFTAGAKDFMKRYPDVKVKVMSALFFDAKEYLETLESVVATNPDGLAVQVVDALAIDETVKKAIARGIPAVQFNILDDRPDAPPYLTYIGGDEYLTGKKLGERLLKEITPKHVATCLPHVGHAGAELRAKGMKDAVEKAGAKFEKLAIGEEPSHATEVLTSYLMKNPDVDAIFVTATLATTWVYSVMENLGRTNIKLLTVDAAPVALEGIIAGKVLATHSQGFYAQATMPYEWLYYYLEYGLEPPPTILTGPVVIDRTNVEKFKKMALTVFGKETYEKITMW